MTKNMEEIDELFDEISVFCELLDFKTIVKERDWPIARRQEIYKDSKLIMHINYNKMEDNFHIFSLKTWEDYKNIPAYKLTTYISKLIKI